MNFDDFEYEIKEIGAVVTKYKGGDAIVKIPFQINGQRVTSIGAGLAAYTITHHARQGAIGLPFIE